MGAPPVAGRARQANRTAWSVHHLQGRRHWRGLERSHERRATRRDAGPSGRARAPTCCAAGKFGTAAQQAPGAEVPRANGANGAAVEKALRSAEQHAIRELLACSGWRRGRGGGDDDAPIRGHGGNGDANAERQRQQRRSATERRRVDAQRGRDSVRAGQNRRVGGPRRGQEAAQQCVAELARWSKPKRPPPMSGRRRAWRDIAFPGFSICWSPVHPQPAGRARPTRTPPSIPPPVTAVPTPPPAERRLGGVTGAPAPCRAG